MGRRAHRGRRGKYERKVCEESRGWRPEEWASLANTPPSSAAAPVPARPGLGPPHSLGIRPAACSASGTPHRLQHLRNTCDTVDVELQPLGRRDKAGQGHEATRVASQHN